ncbi:MAG: hypothetical protein CFE45_25185 [Burkholderiales bacterium PBB5]|nr:MAG: hypothetical protein CFE45_25185 [Burkholderiales bacterium PBB5]
MVAHWAATTRQQVKGALLVSVPDPEGSNFPKDATHFGGVPLRPMAFATTVVSSDDDPYGSREHMVRCASAWGSRLVPVSGLGHINAQSGLGNWPAGRAILDEVALDPGMPAHQVGDR